MEEPEILACRVLGQIAHSEWHGDYTRGWRGTIYETEQTQRPHYVVALLLIVSC